MYILATVTVSVVKNLTDVFSAPEVLEGQEICKVTIEFTVIKDLASVLNVTKTLVLWEV